MTKVPAIKPNGLNGCSNTTVNADAISKAGPDGNCWWSCAGCTRPSDITTCPSKGTLGASFDDGPSEFTPNVLQYLDENKLKATFFVVGSRAVSSPDILRAEYMAGHQLCLHTWSHPSLTTITNEQIVAEFAWSMKAFKDILGIEPNCARPPYSDVDDRVRYILNAMGLKTILWTRTPTTNYDTNDWRVVAGSVTAATSLQTFQGFLANRGIEADPGMKVQSISDCLGQPLSASYFETGGAAGTPGTTGNSSVGPALNPKSASALPKQPGSSANRSGASRTHLSLPVWTLVLSIILALV
ncbi:hypothetical protein H4Q26_013543 [Puccinia striiformis f. sp. tritici PST-130]|nr:hypothetical protein H4Q26_013543 [Puccinia striiformis f. sp. tritici PST-130]